MPENVTYATPVDVLASLRLHLKRPDGRSHKQNGDPRSDPKATVQQRKTPPKRGLSVCPSRYSAAASLREVIQKCFDDTHCIGNEVCRCFSFDFHARLRLNLVDECLKLIHGGADVFLAC